jgi:hypothetical protein
LGDGDFPGEGAMVIAVRAIPKLFREIELPETRSSLLWGLLKQLRRHESWEVLVHGLKRALPRAFGVDVLRCDEAEKIVSSWLTHQSGLGRDQ